MRMQTFLPFPDYQLSMTYLDNARLGKQRVEAQQIFNVIRVRQSLPVDKIMVSPTVRPTKNGWHNHSAVRMWLEAPLSLLRYAIESSNEWIKRGKVDNLKPLFIDRLETLRRLGYPDNDPSWLGDVRVHSSHRSNLMDKFPAHYSRFNWSEKPGDPYFWPR